MKLADQELIENYLLGQLTGPDLEQFLSRIKTDEALAEEVKIQETLFQQINDLGHQKMRTKLERIKKNVVKNNGLEKPATSKAKLVSILLTIAATLALLFIIYKSSNQIVAPEKLYAQYYEAYEIPFSNRAEDVNSDFLNAGNYYQEKNYVKALPIFQSLLSKTEKEDDRILLAIGISQLETKAFQEALNTFVLLQQKEKSLYAQQAEWYSALTYLKLNQTAKAKSILTIISQNEKHFFNQKAIELLPQIK